MKSELAKKLLEIQLQDQEATSAKNSANVQAVHYENRAFFVYEAIALALQSGYKAGFRIDPKEPEWPVAFIELPTGQISYHLAQHNAAWDGHTTEQKRLRLLEFVANVIGK